MSIQSIGQNTAQEFFETLIYLTAYEEARSLISNYTKDIDNPILKEAMEDALNVLAFGLVYELIRVEEYFIDRVFAIAGSLVAFLLSPFRGRKFGGKGVKGLLSRFLFRYSDSDRIQLANLVVNQTGNLLNARSNQYQSSLLYQNYNDTKLRIYERERLHFQVADAYSKNYLNTLMFKLFTKTFSQNDEVILKKILGRDSIGNLSVDDINRISDFMFVKDSSGKVVGLTEAFLEILNGLGYVKR